MCVVGAQRCIDLERQGGRGLVVVMKVISNPIRLISTKGLRSLEQARMVEGGTGPNRSHPRRLTKIVLA